MTDGDDTRRHGAPLELASDAESLVPRHGAANGNGAWHEDEDEPPAVNMLQAARNVIELGYPIFPLFGVHNGRCLCGHARCENQGKHPPVEWRDEASADASTIDAWWKRWPNANIGIPQGAQIGLVTLDVDHDTGRAALAMLEQKHGPLPDTVHAQTGGDNDHYLFAHPGGYIKTTVGYPAVDGRPARGLGHIGLDSRADGGYIAAPPSMHMSGKRYRWAPGRELGAFPLAPLPQWIIDILRRVESAASAEPYAPPRLVSVQPYLRAAVDRECSIVHQTAQGGRNVQLNLSAFTLGLLVAGGELSAEVARQSLLAAALSTGLSEREARNTIESGLAGANKPDKRPRRVPEGKPRSTSNGSSTPHTSAVSESPDTSRGESSGEAESAPSEPKVDAPGGIVRIGVAEIFAPLAPSRWAVRELQIGPGRPAMFAGYGASAKTLAVQQLALAKASGTPIWDHYACSPGVVLHLDYEQGKHGTVKRYQRLAQGHGISPEQLAQRLFVGVLPRVYLDDRDAADAFKAAFEGIDLAIIDALRGAAPNSDENDSSIRRTLDLLTYVSEYTGTTCIVLHHAGKADVDDKRMKLRGSGAIYDACGCVLVFEAGKSDGPRHISQEKQPTEAEGPKLAPFDLVVEDVALNGNPNAAVRVAWAQGAASDPAAKAAVAFERDANRLLAVVRAESGIAANSLIERSGMGRTRAFKMLAALVDEQRLVAFDGDNGTKRYRVGGNE